VATLPWEIKNSNLHRYSADMEENAEKLHFQCADFNFATRVTVYAAVYLLRCTSELVYILWQTMIKVGMHSTSTTCTTVCCQSP